MSLPIHDQNDCQTCPPAELAEKTTPEGRSDPLDPSTFICPTPLSTTTVTIEFCDRVSIIIHQSVVLPVSEVSPSVAGKSTTQLVGMVHLSYASGFIEQPGCKQNFC